MPEIRPGPRARAAAAIEAAAPAIIAELAPRHLADPRIAPTGYLSGPGDYEGFYLPPLIRLLAEYVRSGDRAAAALYDTERRRFQWWRESFEERRQALEDHLDADRRAVLNALAQPGLAAVAAEPIDELHRRLVRRPAAAPLTLVLIGDSLMGEIRSAAVAACADGGITVDVGQLYFSSAWKEPLTARLLDDVFHRGADLIGVSLLTFFGLPGYRPLLAQADTCSAEERRRAARRLGAEARGRAWEIRERCDAPLALHNASGVWHDTGECGWLSAAQEHALALINEAIAALAAELPATELVDEAALVAGHGVDHLAGGVVDVRLTEPSPFHASRLGWRLADQYADRLRVLAAG